MISQITCQSCYSLFKKKKKAVDGTLPVKIQIEFEFRYSVFKQNASLQWYENEGVKIITGTDLPFTWKIKNQTKYTKQ